MRTVADYVREAVTREFSTVPRVLRRTGDLDEAVAAALDNFQKDTGFPETVGEREIEERLQNGSHIQRLMLLNFLGSVPVPSIAPEIVALIDRMLESGEALCQWDVLIVGVTAACKEPEPSGLRRLFELAAQFPWDARAAALIPEVLSALFSGVWRLGLPTWGLKAFENLLNHVKSQGAGAVAGEVLAWDPSSNMTWRGPLADSVDADFFDWSSLEKRLIAQDLGDFLSGQEGG